MKRKFSLIVAAAVLLCIAIGASMAVTSMRKGHSAGQLNLQRKAIERAAVLCYALEGAYPPDISYLEQRYGLILNHDSYIIHYDTFGANIRPEIEVFQRTGGAAHD